jgi:hypothetical protein
MTMVKVAAFRIASSTRCRSARKPDLGRPVRLHRRLLYVATALAFFDGSRALAADVVTLRCDFPNFYQNIVADQKGISITQYQPGKDGKLEYVKSYTENKKDGGSESYYRINSVEIAWGTTYTLLGMKFDSSIDLRAGVVKSDLMVLKTLEQRPTETGACKPN